MGTKTFNNYEDLLTFTRASKGHALRPVSYGTELVTNGDFSSSDLTGWSSFDGTIAVSSGELELTYVADTQYVLHSITTEVGKIYVINVDAYSSNAVNFRLAVENNTFGGGTVAQGYEAAFTSTASNRQLVFIAEATTSVIQIFSRLTSGTAYYDNISVKEVTFDESDGTLTLFEHPNNIPRVEWDAQRNRLGLLVEEARTNTIQYSEDFENSYWGKGGGFSIYGNNGIAPDGTRTATLITDVDEDSYMVRGGGVASNGQTKSIWARTVSGTGKVTLLKHNSVSAALFDLTEEWQRFELPVDISESGGASFYAIDFRASGTTLTEAYIWGAQLETGGFATSYIRSNSGSSTSRSADVASIDVDQFGYNQSEGTLLIQASSSNDTPSFAALSDTTASNRMLSYVSASNIRWYVVDGGTAQANIASGISYSEGDSYKIANAYKADDFAINVNGETSVTDTLGSVSSGVSILNIGTSNSGGAPLNGHIKSLTYTPKRLSNAKLQELTS